MRKLVLTSLSVGRDRRHAWRSLIVLPGLISLLPSCAPGEISKRSAERDDSPPTVRISQPSEGASIGGASLTLDVEYADQGSGIAVNSLKVFLNGRDVSGFLDQHSRGTTGQFSAQQLQLGENKLKVEVADRAGNVSRAEMPFFYRGSGWLTLLGVLQGQAGHVESLALTTDGKMLASGSDDGRMRLWDLSGPKPRKVSDIKGQRKGVTSLAFSPSSELLASGSEDGTIRLWTVKDSLPSQKAVLKGHWRAVSALTFAPDGKTLASGGKDGAVRLWDVKGSDQKEVAALEGHRLDVFSIAFASDGRTAASAGWDKTVRLWNLDGPKPKEHAVLKVQQSTVSSLAFASDGKTLATGTDDGRVRFWSLSAPDVVEQAAVLGHRENAWVLAFSADSRSVISAGGDGRLALWDVSAKTMIADQTLPGPARVAASIAGGRVVAIGYDNGTIYVLGTDVAAARPAK